MAEVKLNSVVKRYGDATILHGISAAIADGEFVVIVGPSGCGKSTLLRSIAGLESVSGGSIEIGGRDVTRLEPKDRDIAMVFQNYALYPHMSVFDNMAYGLRIRGLSDSDIRRRVDDAAEILQLGHLLQRRPRDLSGGQRQRVAMGRAIVREPACFLFDEPLSNLDAKLRVQMRVEIKRLQQRLGITSIYVTHDQVEAMTLADRLIVMKDGHAEQIGAPLELYHRPQTQFVAGFIGSPAMNFLPGPEGIILGVRPEHLHPDSAGSLVVTVDLIEALGADTLAYGHVPDGVAASLVVRLPGNQAIAPGDVLRLSAAAEHWHRFDGAGLRVV